MSVIAQDEKEAFLAILARHRFAEGDFVVTEAGAPDVVDDVYPLQGYVTVVRQSNAKEREYRTGHGTDWTVAFEKDLNKHAFG